jgi:hypothetical protein
MRLKFFVVVFVLAAAPIVALAQSDKPSTRPSKPTFEDAQKLVETITFFVGWCGSNDRRHSI